MQNNFQGYSIEFSQQASKDLKKIESSESRKIDRKLKDLVGGNPNVDIKKIEGAERTYRLRCGDYRVIFEVHKHIITILVVGVGHRREVYRGY